uniref:ATP synthase subunit beta, mitochondrial (Fragments) n=1 Tax=Penicillium glabrum TaxID=69773 RepID=ATPB_PENGL|nr:RecName: Full=ATP synthase subunit beta, mitochondrial [Penicillium glabrum]
KVHQVIGAVVDVKFRVPVGAGTLGRIINVTGDPIDERGKIGLFGGAGVGKTKVALVFGQMNEPPGARARFTQAGSEVSALLGRMRGISELGIYPAVDPLDSKSRVQQMLQEYKS